MNEAMALAAMTPVCGMQGPHSGSFIVNVIVWTWMIISME